ncbi:Serine/threonine-protein phosphatase 6 regulatory ankyrin repeat subunit C [Symbiodinium microadriaticum]|uniref:Serine/threonine-protein phosphatase 6 regulatory ankyrin repeat subunit C n=1 Tax=Symbiodinium microadriaticum TaxID=2951 RepID=A0A1Q9C576_SYMMI|nr:Serine/threonine-protein phosphatase 6 regulatory ankyrin repeat subunit C [Symbiodinium microadriaticum]
MLSGSEAITGARDFLGRSPLHVATLANATAAAKELLQSSAAGAPLLEARLADGRFALHLAAMHGFEEIVELILERLGLFCLQADPKRLELAKQSLSDDRGEERTGQAIVHFCAGDGVPKPEEIFDIDAADWEVKLSRA